MFERNALRRGQKPKRFQISGSTLKLWGMLFSLVGVFGIAVLQNGVLGLKGYTLAELDAAMNPGGDVFVLAGWIILCNAVATLALPIFSCMLVEGFVHTSNIGRYLLRLGAFALVCELPFNFAMKGTWFDITAQNPLFSLFISLLMLCFLRRFDASGVRNGLFKALIVGAAMFWAIIMQGQLGLFFVAMVAVFWFFRGGGMVLSAAGVVVSLLQFPAPLAFVLTHAYSGEKGKINKWVFYAIYPAGLLILGLVGRYLIR